jgi:hypothetical protein
LAGSSATNIANGRKKKRSTEPDADPGFHQIFQSGSQSQNFDCTGTYGCYPVITDHNDRDYDTNYYYYYYDYDYYDQANRTNPGFDQTYKAGSQYENIDSSGSTTGKITVTGGGHNSDVSHSGINSNENVMGHENPCVPCGINTSCYAEPRRSDGSRYISCKCLPGNHSCTMN